MSINHSALAQARWERNAYLSCASLVLYEYFLQFDSEVEFFWKQRWSLAKFLFLWNRYYSLAFNIFHATSTLPRHACIIASCIYLPMSRHISSLAGVSTRILQTPPLPISANFKGSKFFHWQNTGASLQMITTHVILELRLWAMYGSTRKVLWLFILLTIGEATALGIVFGVPNPKLVGTNEPFPGAFICADADPNDGSRWVVYYWVSILIIETILLSLALRKAWLHRSSAGGNHLMQQLTRDSVIYFFAIFWIYLANLILWIVNRITLNELGTAFSFVLSSIFANRLLITVRSAHYRGRTNVGTYLPSVHFLRRFPRSNNNSDALNNSIELTTFNEKTGV